VIVENEEGKIEDATFPLPATLASMTGSTSRPPQPLNGHTVIHCCHTCNGCKIIVDQASTVPDGAEDATATDDKAAEVKPANGTTATGAHGGGDALASLHTGLIIMVMTSAIAVLMM